MLNLSNHNILVTGGAGFFGSHVVEKLLSRGVPKSQITIPRSAENDLRMWEVCKKVVQGQEVVIHMAANVGGIGYNREHAGELFYDNAIMGIQMMEAARQAGVKKYVQIGTICAYPKFTPVPFKEDDLWNGYPEETNAPYGLAKKMMLVQAQSYRQQYGFNAIYLLPVNLYGPCFSFDTAVMTKKGIKNITQIKKGDIVYTLNPKSFKIEESKVIATQQTMTNEMFVFKGKSADFKVTPDHKIFYKTSTGFVKRHAEFFRNRAGKKYGQITFAVHKVKKDGARPLLVDFSEYVDKDHFYIDNNYVKDFVGSSGNSSKPFPLKYKTKAFAQFLGWYISEGSIAQIGKKSYQIRITQYNSVYRKEIEKNLISLGIAFGCDKTAFYFTSRIWKRFIEQHIGKGAENKRIPAFVLNWHHSLLVELFNALMKGDGNRSGRRYTTKSNQLLCDFLHLAFLCGKKIGSVYHDGSCWRISLRTKKKAVTVKYKDIAVQNVTETAYCITTDKNHIIFAGRNFKFNWIGQCDDFDPASSHVIPALIKKVHDAQKAGQNFIEVWGSGKPSREFIYVEDAAEAVALATEKYDKPDPVNIGAGFEITIKDLIELICRLMDFKGEIRWDPSKPDGQPRRMIDVSRAQREFGFNTKVGFDAGLSKTIEWYKTANI